VPVTYLSPEGDDGGLSIRPGGVLSDLAPTLLGLLDVDQPREMAGETLLDDAD
jgi:2,3-bisphosphoglycerate-independent phosphoglycerate mutase